MQIVHYLKWKREDLWRKYHKATNDNDKNIIKKEINELTEKIDTIQAHKNACNRIIGKYFVIRNDNYHNRNIQNKEKRRCIDKK